MNVRAMPGQSARVHGDDQADICVILNRGSGRKKDRSTEDALHAAFDRHPGRFDLRIVERGRSISAVTAHALRAGYSTIAAAGGDGTIGAVAGTVAGSGHALGVIPMGTFNYFARGYGIPLELDAAVDLLATGTAQQIAVGEVNGHLFLNNASLGVYPAILRQREDTYRRWGRSQLAAHWSVLVTFATFRSSLSIRVTVDGQELRTRTPLVFVARSAYQLERFELEGADCIRDNRFALFVAPDGGRLDLLRYAWRLARHSMKSGRDFDLHCAREIVIETRQPFALLARDGERVRLRGPFRFSVRPDALRLVMPDAASNPSGVVAGALDAEAETAFGRDPDAESGAADLGPGGGRRTGPSRQGAFAEARAEHRDVCTDVGPDGNPAQTGEAPTSDPA